MWGEEPAVGTRDTEDTDTWGLPGVCCSLARALGESLQGHGTPILLPTPQVSFTSPSRGSPQPLAQWLVIISYCRALQPQMGSE